MPSFYFEQLLQRGLSGIDQQGITAAVLKIAGIVLVFSLLWSVYEAYSNGGDVRLLGIAAVKYLVIGLVFLNYPSAFRAVNSMFNGVADGIYNLSGGLDAVQSWLNSLSLAWNSNPNWFSAIWNLVSGGAASIIAGLITLVGYVLLPFTYTLFTLFYALYGSILYVVGPFVLALIPSRGLGQPGRSFFVNMMIFQCWGLLYAILQSLMSALEITDPMQFTGSFLNAFSGSSQVIVMSIASLLLVHHDRADSVHRQPHRARRHREHAHDGGQYGGHGGCGGFGLGICWWRGHSRRKSAAPRKGHRRRRQRVPRGQQLGAPGSVVSQTPELPAMEVLLLVSPDRLLRLASETGGTRNDRRQLLLALTAFAKCCRL